MAAGNRIERQYPAHKLPKKKTSEQIAIDIAEFETKHGPVKESPIRKGPIEPLSKYRQRGLETL